MTQVDDSKDFKPGKMGNLIAHHSLLIITVVCVLFVGCSPKDQGVDAMNETRYSIAPTLIY